MTKRVQESLFTPIHTNTHSSLFNSNKFKNRKKSQRHKTSWIGFNTINILLIQVS